MSLSPKEEAVLQLLQENSSYENYFFDKVSNLKWFFPLKEKGYFSPRKAPGPKPAKQEGHYEIPHWNILSYLERISQQINLPGYDKYLKELLMIIEEVSNYKNEIGEHIDNYRIWWYFTKILLNISNERLPVKIIELIPIWLGSKFNTILQGSDITMKLLPKFLPDNPTKDDIKKAGLIVDYITDIKMVSVHEKSTEAFFGRAEEPKTVIDTYWLMESYIGREIAIKVGEKCSVRPIFVIADRLKEIFRRKNPKSWIDIEHEDKIYRIMIFHTNEFEFDLSVGIFRKGQVQLDKSEGEPRKGFFDNTENRFRFELRTCKNVGNFIEKFELEISKSSLPRDVKKELDEKTIKALYERIYSDYSYIWLRSISSGPGATTFGTEETFTVILSQILLAKVKSDKLAAKTIFKEFLSERYQYPIFTRLVLFLVSEYWAEFKQEFWDIINAPEGEQLFDNFNYKAEMYALLRKNIEKFTPDEKVRLKEIIEKGPQKFLPEGNLSMFGNYWKQQWFFAVKADPDFLSLYEKQKEITKIDEEVNFKEPEVKFGYGSSPIPKEDILRMANEELAKFVETFKTEDFWNGPTVEGLGEHLKAAAHERPEKFINDLKPFLNTSYYYISEMMWGIKDAWSEKKLIDWGKVFVFIKQYINRAEFRLDKIEIAGGIFQANHNRVAEIVAVLIQEGTEDDGWAFDEGHLPVAQEILFFLIDKLKVEKEKEISNPVIQTMNSVSGRVLTALIYLALRIARLEGKKGEKKDIKWSDEFKDRYEKMLKDGVYEAYTLLGRYMPNLYFLDKGWIEQKIRELENIEQDQLWSAFMSGYLFGGRFNDSLYKLMRNHYLKAISYSFKEKYVEEQLAHHIAIGYLRSLGDLSKGSLIDIILTDFNYVQQKNLIGFFWMQRKEYQRQPSKAVIAEVKGGDGLPRVIKFEDKKKAKLPLEDNERPKIERKIIEFWRRIFNIYKVKQEKNEINEEDKKILSNLVILTVFFSKLDSENICWLILSAPYVNLDISSYFFIEYLDKLKDEDNEIESGRYVARIFLEMLKVFTPEYDSEHIRSIIKYLYEIKDSETIDAANKICNIYGSRGVPFLREIYDNNQKNIHLGEGSGN